MTERGSTQHSPRIDDELERETESLQRGAPIESHVEEWRQQEPPAEGEPPPRSRVAGDDIELRSVLAISLRPSACPCDRDVLLAVALDEHAEDFVVEWLRTLPAGVAFANVEAVWEALGGSTEHRASEPPERRAPEAAVPTSSPPPQRRAPAPTSLSQQSIPAATSGRSLVARVLEIPSAVVHDATRIAGSVWRWAGRRVRSFR